LSTSWEQAVRTHPVDKLLQQHRYKSAAGLLQLVRFYSKTLHQQHQTLVQKDIHGCNPSEMKSLQCHLGTRLSDALRTHGPNSCTWFDLCFHKLLMTNVEKPSQL
jgi:hypothetical protein